MVFPRIFPFILFMAFIGVDELLRSLRDYGIIFFEDDFLYFLYPVKALSVFFTLLYFRSRYKEIDLGDLRSARNVLVSVAVGMAVFFLWINMDWKWATVGALKGFNPLIFPEGPVRVSMIASRLFGAVVVVPIMEELFWRSFLIRYIVSNDFAKVPVGLFTWPSFIITVVLFGAEHNLIAAGIMAGIAYNLLLYRSKSLTLCIIAHAITNLALGVYVLQTERWFFW